MAGENVKMNTYTFKQVAQITGETKQRIQYWVLKGVLTPFRGGHATGTGTSRLYSYSNLVEISIGKGLTRYGIYVTCIKEIVYQVKEQLPELFIPQVTDIDNMALIQISRDKVTVDTPGRNEYKEKADKLLYGTQVLFILNLGTLKNNLDKLS